MGVSTRTRSLNLKCLNLKYTYNPMCNHNSAKFRPNSTDNSSNNSIAPDLFTVLSKWPSNSTLPRNHNAF
jgi:hypothetical protein